MRQTHLLYIDDSGTKEYAEKPEKYTSKGGKSRYFVFCGVLLPMKSASDMNTKIISLKLKYFGDETVELKSNWLRMPKERNTRYLTPFSLTDDELNSFVSDFYELLLSCDCKLVASVIDKQHMQEFYERPFYPPSLAYETLLLRVQQELKSTDTLGVIMDDTTGKTPKGNDYKILLDKQHKSLKQFGSKLWKGHKFPSLQSLRFVSSQISHSIQVADMCAYNVNRQFLLYGREWEDPECKSLPCYEYFEKITEKFRCDDNGRIQGFGIVKMPEINKIKWGKKKKESEP